MSIRLSSVTALALVLGLGAAPVFAQGSDDSRKNPPSASQWQQAPNNQAAPSATPNGGSRSNMGQATTPNSNSMQTGQSTTGTGGSMGTTGSSGSSMSQGGTGKSYGQSTGSTYNQPQAGSGHMQSSANDEDKVRDAQEALNKQGANLKVDGVMGPKTEAALKQYQQSHGMRATGELDDQTAASLK